MNKKFIKLLLSIGLLFTFSLAGCKNGGDSPSTPPEPEVVNVTNVGLDQSLVRMYVGDTTTLNAIVIPTNATNQDVTWASSNEQIVTVNAGTLTALSVGEADVTVTTVDAAKTASAHVVVSAKTVAVESVSLNKQELTLYVDETETLFATVLPANATDKSVTWSTSDAEVATVTNGAVTAIKVGEATITVTTVDGNKTASAHVTVSSRTIAVESVSLNKQEVALTAGETETLVETVLPEDATNKAVTWSTSDAEVATVTNGAVTAIKAGEATIIVRTVDGNKTASAHVTVSAAVITPTGLYLDKSSLSLLAGETETITATVAPEGATYELEWASEDETVATVADGVVTAVDSGETYVVASIKNTNLSEKCLVTVAAAFHDYVKDGSVKLGLDYVGKDFYADGVEQVTLQTAIDGDTAHFKTKTVTLKSRFYGIDTPESTGKVQPWGVEASDFTKKKLKAANENGTIVVSSPQSEYGAPSPDSTGSRYVSLIWINETKKDASLDELYLLNLWIVQEGLSLVRSISAFPEYEESFTKSQDQAQTYKLNMWSGEKAPGYNYDEGYMDVSLLDIKREVEKSFADPTYVNAYDNQKVRFTGVVSSYNDGTLYVQEFYPDDEDNPTVGEWAGINIFCGMSTISSKFTAPNTYLQVYGLCKDSETFGFQITDTQGKWKTYGAGDEDCKVLLKADENIDEHSLYTFHYTVSELNTIASNKDCESLFCAVSVTGEVTCSDAFVSDDRAVTVYFAETEWNVYIPFMYHGDLDNPAERWDTKEQFIGKKFRIDAGTYAWHKTQKGKIVFQIIPTNEASFVWVNE